MSNPLLAVAVFGPAIVLGAALFSQFVGGLSPCPMCIWQRWPHVAATTLSLLALFAGPGAVGRALLAMAAVGLLFGAGIGVFHAGVEARWWEGPTTCSGGNIGALSTEALIDQIMAAPLVRCDEVAWSFLGLSMAAWNAICSLLLAAATALAARRYASNSASQ